MENEVLEKYRKAGKIASQVREWSKSLVKEGAKLIDIANAIDKKVIELGGSEAFPVNLSINSIAAHYTPNSKDETILRNGDLLKIDIGIHIDGFIADTACTIDVGDKLHSKLISASEEALKAAIATVKAGVTVSEIGSAIETAIKKQGYSPIANLSGHEVEEYNLHAGLTIPNFKNGSTVKLEEDMVIAIEPFATNGTGSVIETRDSEIFQLLGPKPVRLPVARKIMDLIAKEKHSLPFCKRWLVKKVGDFGVETAIRELWMKGALHRYPVLKEEKDGLVSQAEHTMLVTKTGVEIFTL